MKMQKKAFLLYKNSDPAVQAIDRIKYNKYAQMYKIIYYTRKRIMSSPHNDT